MQDTRRLRRGASPHADDLDAYFKLARRLKRKFNGEIDLKIDLEVDYIPGYGAWARDLLNKYGPERDDALLSIHLMQGKGGWH